MMPESFRITAALACEQRKVHIPVSCRCYGGSKQTRITAIIVIMHAENVQLGEMIRFGCMDIMNVAMSAVLGAEMEPASFAGSSSSVQCIPTTASRVC